jgi:hypothetical protein
MGKNRVFFPQAALDHWLIEGRVDLSDNQLVIKARGRRYRIVEAVRVLSVVSEGTDLHDVVGRVKTVAHLRELGAELLGDSMIIGDVAYEVVPGFWGSPIGTFEEHQANSSPPSSFGMPSPPPEPKTDEELLAQYLMQNLE